MSLMSLLFTVTFATEILHKLSYVYLYLMINVSLSSLQVKTLNILTFDSVGNFDLVKLHQFLSNCNKVHNSRQLNDCSIKPVPLVGNPIGRRELWLISRDHHACVESFMCLNKPRIENQWYHTVEHDWPTTCIKVCCWS